MKKTVLFSSVAALALSAGSVFGSALQLSLTPDTAIEPRTERIEGFSLNFWGENPQDGFALGIINGATQDSSGFMLGLFHNYADAYQGAQMALFNEANTIQGAQLGFINFVKVEIEGAQIGAANINQGDLYGAQLGLFNYTAKKVTGAQVGLVNHANNLEGVQLGLINYVESFGWFDEFPSKLARGFVFVNWGF